MSVVVRCSDCGEKIGEYTGITGFHIPVQSKYFVRVDGTSPEHGSATAHNCPRCGKRINELECTLVSISESLQNPPIPAQLKEDDDESSSDCCS